jgi:hypothetical protein
MVTRSVPLYRHGELVGVATTDLPSPPPPAGGEDTVPVM